MSFFSRTGDGPEAPGLASGLDVERPELAVEIARERQPEVILMDINLPGISGIEAMKILRADPSTAHIPIIALSAIAVPRDIEKALEAGFFNYLTKPIKVDEFMETLRVDLFSDEVYVFTPKGEVKSLPAGATPLDFAYEIHTDVGHRCVGAKVNGKIVPLHYELQSGDICEVLTSKKERGPSRDWLSLAKTTRAQSKIRAWFKRERREDSERTGWPLTGTASGKASAS